jgi:hypothetical protein
MCDVLPALTQCSNLEEILRKTALGIPIPIGDVQSGNRGEQFTLQDVLEEALLARRCHAYDLEYQPPRTTTITTTKPLDRAPAPASPPRRSNAEASPTRRHPQLIPEQQP